MRCSVCLTCAMAAFGLVGCSTLMPESPLPQSPDTTVLTYTVGFAIAAVAPNGSPPLARRPVDEEERLHAYAASRLNEAGANPDEFDTVCIAEVAPTTFDALQRVVEAGLVEPALSDPADPDHRNVARWDYGYGHGLGTGADADEAMRRIFFRIATPNRGAIAFADPPAVRDADGRVFALMPAAFQLADHVALEALVASGGCPHLTEYLRGLLERR